MFVGTKSKLDMYIAVKLDMYKAVEGDVRGRRSQRHSLEPFLVNDMYIAVKLVNDIYIFNGERCRRRRRRRLQIRCRSQLQIRWRSRRKENIVIHQNARVKGSGVHNPQVTRGDDLPDNHAGQAAPRKLVPAVVIDTTWILVHAVELVKARIPTVVPKTEM